MSGTSLDGVDAALIETDGEAIEAFGPSLYRPYSEAERGLLRAALAAGTEITERSDRTGILGEAETLINQSHAETVENLLKMAGVRPSHVDVVGFHGQTVIHKPAIKLTVQLGDGPWLAERLGIAVVHDIRAADIEAGGQGAPVVPVFHRALAGAGKLPEPAAILNIGGVANVTWVGPGGDLNAFDTGPGNALLDDLMRARNGQEFDKDGEIARRGTTDKSVLYALLTSDFFAKKPPKSLDRFHFHEKALTAVAHLSTEDAASTLVDFTAATIALSVQHMKEAPKRWVVAGGGARNLAILAALRERIAVPVSTAEDMGWSIDALEAQAFAYLAVRSLKGLPNTYPSTTGVPTPVSGGVLAGPKSSSGNRMAVR
ncbi:anhydro-N-acetylmuramic acid kinase [Terrihabitans soli]